MVDCIKHFIPVLLENPSFPLRELDISSFARVCINCFFVFGFLVPTRTNNRLLAHTRRNVHTTRRLGATRRHAAPCPRRKRSEPRRFDDCDGGRSVTARTHASVDVTQLERYEANVLPFLSLLTSRWALVDMKINFLSLSSLLDVLSRHPNLRALNLQRCVFPVFSVCCSPLITCAGNALEDDSVQQLCQALNANPAHCLEYLNVLQNTFSTLAESHLESLHHVLCVEYWIGHEPPTRQTWAWQHYSRRQR